jgi:hypothetical protein
LDGTAVLDYRMRLQQFEQPLSVVGVETHESDDVSGGCRRYGFSQQDPLPDRAPALEHPAPPGGGDEVDPLRVGWLDPGVVLPM